MLEHLGRIVRFRFWFAIAGCVLTSSLANAVDITYEKITFLNFSDDPIEVSWIGRDERAPFTVAPYELHAQNTFSGHKYTYKWKGSDIFLRVRSESDVTVDLTEDGSPKEINTKSIVPQVHILGGMDQPETKKVVCGTTKGDIHINVKPFWAPTGAARFLQLVHEEIRYFDGCALNRVVPKFLTQFGIGANYHQRNYFRKDDMSIPDDPQLDPPIHFRPGTMSYAGSGKNSRSTEMFIVMPDTPLEQLNYFGQENSWETPFGYVEPVDLEVVGSWHAYGDMPPVSEVLRRKNKITMHPGNTEIYQYIGN